MASLHHIPEAEPSDTEARGDGPDRFDFAHILQTPVWVFDIDTLRVLHANAAACAMWRAESEAELCQRDFGKDMSTTVHERLRQYQSDFDKGLRFKEMWTLYPNGVPTSIEVLFAGFRKDDGQYALLCEATHQVEEVPENQRSLEALLHTDVMISLYAKNGRVLYRNPAARNSALKTQDDFAAQFVNPQDHDVLMFELDRNGGHSLVAEVETTTGPRWHKLTVKSCLDAATGDAANLVTANDVTELRNARDRARYLANRDQLTGCFNRFYLQQKVSEMAQSNAGKCGLLFFDVDRFKQINDRFGHECGDAVLTTLASRAESTIGERDVLARLGGDEFVVLFTSVDDESAFERLSHTLLEELRKPLVHKAVKLAPTVSMGLAFFVPGPDDFTSILRQADIALYTSKVDGRNRLTVFTEALGAAAHARDQLERDLKLAVERDEFDLHYQPRVDLADGQVVSVEALVRWQHPKRGLVMPNDFIPFCEETGLIEAVGHLVLRAGLTQALQWSHDGLGIHPSINISPRQFDDPKLMDALLEFASKPGFPVNGIELELTENVLVGDHAELARKLRAISDLGYRIAIDDFGMGYSNLSYISDFPVDCIKIDRTFITRLPETGPVVRLILTLARQIGALTVAEGVETEAQANWLQCEGCDQAQGFLFSRPMTVPDLVAALADHAV